MKILKLTQEFYDENIHLDHVMDKINGKWDETKTRGYGIVVLSYNGLEFGIPLRSNFTNRKTNSCFETVKGGNKGLDYSKAVLLTKESHKSDEAFIIPKEEYIRVQNKAHFIGRKFGQYVEKYMKGVRKQDQNILRHYQFSTLQNYHDELGL